MANYILIHGAWHGSWCWKYVVPLLEAQGHSVTNLDLPGTVNNPQDFSSIDLKCYVDFVESKIEAIDGNVILIGHSMAGTILASVAEKIPHKIEKLIFISAFIPENGQSMFDQASTLSGKGISTEMLVNIPEFSVDLKRSEHVKEVLFNMCSQENAREALSLLQKQPIKPFNDIVHITEQNFGSIPKLYINCVRDEVISTKDQYKIATNSKCEIANIESDHSPFFSAPHELVEIILGASACNI